MAGVFAFRGFLNTSIPEILKGKNLCNVLLNILGENYCFEILVLKFLEIPGTQTLLLYGSQIKQTWEVLV